MSMDPSENTVETTDTAVGTIEPEVPSSQLPELTIGAGSPSTDTVGPAYQPTIRGKIDRFGVAMGTGRRKTSVARVRIKEGSGQFLVNGRPLEEYLRVERDRESVMVPLKVAGKVGQVDISVRVQGGGTTGQTGAIILGVARALQGMNPGWHHLLADAGLLTRDDRMVERKKYGFKKARRSFQFSKR
jgi:small subunit ribosomal protein S9